jgi:hypothetical protein
MALDLPTDWFEVDPRAPDLMAELLRATAPRATPDLAGETLAALLLPVFVEVRRAQQHADVVMLAGFLNSYAGEEPDVPYIATASMSAVLSPPFQGDVRVTESLVRTGPADKGRNVRVVTLPSGEAVMTQGRTVLKHETWDDAIDAYGKRFYAPVPDDDRLLVLSFVTPNLALQDVFDELFDSIAESLSFDASTEGS